MKMNRIIVFSLAICVFGLLCQSGAAVAAEPDFDDLDRRERIFVGGFVGLQFGTLTDVSVSLHAGYRVTRRLSAGLGGAYQFTSDTWFGNSYSSHMYGGSVFARFNVYSHFFLHGEYKRLRLQSRIPPFDPDFDPDTRTTITEDNYFIGAGYGFPVSDNLRMNFLLLYNLNSKSQAYRDNPLFRVGVDIYL